MTIKLKRIYDKPEKGDGYRILVDRLWPRGLSKKEAGVDAWMKEIAPSIALRKWFSHEPGKWKQFKGRYATELKREKELVDKIRQLGKEKRNITLLYSAKDERHNNAVVLFNLLERL